MDRECEIEANIKNQNKTENRISLFLLKDPYRRMRRRERSNIFNGLMEVTRKKAYTQAYTDTLVGFDRDSTLN